MLNNGSEIPSVVRHGVKDEYAIYYSENIGRTVTAIIQTVDSHNDSLIDLRVERPSLEDRFLELTDAGTRNA